MEKTTETTRVRINYKKLSSGKVQLDITSEAETTDKAVSLLDNTLIKATQLVEARGEELV